MSSVAGWNMDRRKHIIVYLENGREDLIELEDHVEARYIQEQLELNNEGQGATLLIYGKTGEHIYPANRIIKIETIKE